MAETPKELKVDITDVEDLSVSGTLGSIPLRKYLTNLHIILIKISYL